jgi:hypothetical protein
MCDNEEGKTKNDIKNDQILQLEDVNCRTCATSRRSSTLECVMGGMDIWSMWGDKEFVVS